MVNYCLKYNDNYSAINIVFCKTKHEQTKLIKYINIVYKNYNTIIYKSKSNYGITKYSFVSQDNKLQYKDSIILTDISVYLNKDNGLFDNRIDKFKTPVFVFSKINTVNTSEIDLYKNNRIIISSSVLKKSQLLHICNKKIISAKGFTDWLLHYDNILYLFQLDNMSIEQGETSPELNEEDYIEYFLENPITYEKENQPEPLEFF